MDNGLGITSDLFKKGPVLIIKWRYADNWPVEDISPNASLIVGYDNREMTATFKSLKGIIYADRKSVV